MKAPLGTIAALLVFRASVLADDRPDVPDELPLECQPFAAIEPDTESQATWNQVLSFAACLQDGSLARIENPDELPALIAQFQLAHAPSMTLYLAALQYGPPDVQLRAAFQIGQMQIGLISRARASLVAPADRRTNRRSAASYRELQQRLEPLLEDTAKLGWMLFNTIRHTASENPSLVFDDVTRNMVRAAADLERSLRWSMSLPTTEAPSLIVTTH